MAFVVRREVMDELVKNKDWADRLDRCKTTSEVQELIDRFCKEKGFKVETVNI